MYSRRISTFHPQAYTISLLVSKSTKKHPKYSCLFSSNSQTPYRHPKTTNIGKNMKRSATSNPPISPPAGKKKVTGTNASAVSNFFVPTSKKVIPTFRIVDQTMVAGYYKIPAPVKQSQGSSDAASAVGAGSTSSAKGKSSAAKKLVANTEAADAATAAALVSSGAGSGVTASSATFRVCCFDLDSTLVNTKSGNKFAKDAGDWVWWNTIVPKKLQELHAEGIRLVIFTNQNGIKLKSGKNEKRLDEYKGRITQVCGALELPFYSYAATETDMYRKPRTGMFKEFLADLGNDAVNLDMENSVFVGDAAGRKNDFSASDRMFAENIGMAFQTPEQFFLGKPSEPYTLPLDPSSYIVSNGVGSKDKTPVFSKKNPVELVVTVGSPAAGKSTFYFAYLEPLGYYRINQDALKTREKCVKAANEQLSNGNSVVIDNTNPDIDVRAIWKEVAAKHKAAFRCVYLTTPASVCAHNNCFRAFGTTSNPESRAVVPSIAFNFFQKRFVEPTLKEGFIDITKIDFQFHGNNEQKLEWEKHWSS